MLTWHSSSSILNLIFIVYLLRANKFTNENSINTIIVTVLEVIYFYALHSYTTNSSLSCYSHMHVDAVRKYAKHYHDIEKERNYHVRTFAGSRQRNIAFLQAGFVQSFINYSRLQIRLFINQSSAMLCTCFSTEEYIYKFHGNVFEKETFENMRLLSSERDSSQFFSMNGNIARYNDGQYSFTNFKAVLSESEN